MDFNQVPEEINYKEIIRNGYSLSPIMYKKIQISNRTVKKLKDLLVEGNEYKKGNEPGSQWYMKSSDKYLIRTKALQDFSYLIYPKGDSLVPLNPKRWLEFELKHGDILLSKDSNIGETAIVNGDECKNANFSSGIVKLNVKTEYNGYYIFAFLKHPLFKEQLSVLCPKGATIQHAGDRWMDCEIPFPNQKESATVIDWVGRCVEKIGMLEGTIAHKSKEIIHLIDSELLSGQKNKEYQYEYPRLKKITKELRLDAAIYCKEYEEKICLIEGYKGGCYTPDEYGFSVIPGPSLEMKLLKTRIDSEAYVPGFYQLFLPTNLSEYGTVNKVQYLGTKRKLPLLKKGDVLFGEAGFHKGRSIVIMEEIDRCITNAHGLYARQASVNMKKSIFFRCIFDWYRNKGLIDLMAVGGSGGHFSPEYFEYIRIPKFADETVDRIVKLYDSDTDFAVERKLDKLTEKSAEALGIVQLDKELKYLKNRLNGILEDIINDNQVILE